MPTIEVLEGDLAKGKWDFQSLTRRMSKNVTFSRKETVDLTRQLQSVELQSEERVKKLAEAGIWALAGWTLGPAGAAAGFLLGGKRKKVLFEGYLVDGRRFLAITDGDSWKVLRAITSK